MIIASLSPAVRVRAVAESPGSRDSCCRGERQLPRVMFPATVFVDDDLSGPPADLEIPKTADADLKSRWRRRVAPAGRLLAPAASAVAVFVASVPDKKT